MAGWASFFAALVGASAALAGLVFVGVSINLNRILSIKGLAERGLEALALLVAVLLVSALLLVPGQPHGVVGAELLAIGLAVWSVDTTLAVYWLRSLDRKYLRLEVMLSLLGQCATLPYIAAGVAVLARGAGGLYWLVPGVVFSFLVAFMNAWVLLVEINR